MINPLPTCVKPPNAKTRFGAVRSSGNRPAECGGGHCGVDLYLPEGTPVLAVADGKVVASKRSSNVAGEFIWLDHGDWRSHYVHLQDGSRLVSVGQRVSAGQQIGRLGRTGIERDTAHLHFALSRRSGSGWRYFDPLPQLCGSGSGKLLWILGAYFLWRAWRG